ncbi:unnamed protein product [Closterium sp. NIES-64]|nr:unnamed protein product [Closterium sp. NIES-64]
MAITGSCAPLAALVPLFLLLLLLVPESAWIGGIVRVGHALDASNVVGDMGLERGMSLFRQWENAYGLKPEQRLPPDVVSLPPNVPRAPHLEECVARTARRREAEQRGANGESPGWARPADCCKCDPQPPWVRGAEAENLAKTRVAQRDIWERQFPPGDCQGQRLLVLPWSTQEMRGVGSGIHVTGLFLSLSMALNRTLVPYPDSYHHANTSDCIASGRNSSWECFFAPMVSPASSGHNSSWECFFAPMVSPACDALVRRLMETAEGAGVKECASVDYDGLATLNDTVVCVSPLRVDRLKLESRATSLWGSPHLDRLDMVEYMGGMEQDDDFKMLETDMVEGMGGMEQDDDFKMLEVRWWRAQATRFMLRWPSAYLCHVTNRVRHSAYGLHAAMHLSRFEEERAEILRLVAAGDPVRFFVKDTDGKADLDGAAKAQAKALAELKFSGSTLEGQVWPAKGMESCAFDCGPNGEGRWKRKEVQGMLQGVGGEVYAPRPMVSVHVRQSDKFKEMTLLSFAMHMFFAQRLRAAMPDLKHVWLNTEMESVIEQTKQYPSWQFHYSINPRLPPGANDTRAYEFMQDVAVSLASVLIAAECDYFVGSLESNWSRLINELRSTNGRLYAGFIALNIGLW